jgi:hypothetical protein
MHHGSNLVVTEQNLREIRSDRMRGLMFEVLAVLVVHVKPHY